MHDSLTPSRLQFGPFLADFQACELRKEGRKIRLQEKPMRLLAALTARPGEVVSREELQKQLWPDDTFVDFETGLNAAVRKLREALCDSPENPQYIETIPKHGYRFLAEVHRDKSSASLTAVARAAGKMELSSTLGRRTIASLVDSVSEYRRAKRQWMIIAAALGVSCLVLILVQLNVLKAGALHDRVFGATAAPAIHSLAVLPLQNLSADPAQEYFSDGMTDALITDLAQLDGVKVISRTSSMQYKQTKKALPVIARELGVDAIIEGTVQRSGDRVRISAQLINGSNDKHLWAHSYDGDMRDLFELQREVTHDIAGQIRAQLTTKSPEEQARQRPMDPKALDAYLQGNYHMNQQGKGKGDEEKRKAAAFFQQTIDIDPSFAPAYNGLALSHELLWLGSSNDIAVAKRAAQKGVEIDPRYSVTQVTLAGLKWQPDLDVRGAEEGFRRAISLNPDDAWAHSGLCILLIVLGKAEEGLRQCKIAQRLDPFDDDSALGLYFGRDYDGSIAMFRMLLQADPKVGLWHCDLFPDYTMKGMHKEAVEELTQCFSLYGQSQAAANIRDAFTRSGYREAIRQWVKEAERLQAKHQAFLPG